MRLRTVSGSVLASMLVAAGVFATSMPASAAGVVADTATPLPMPSYTDIQVNASRGEVYVAGGDQIVATDQYGTILGTINGQSGVYSLALNADGTLLYAGLSDANAISVIDTVSRSEVSRYSVGTACPGDIAPAQGKLWFSAGCTQGYSGTVSALDLTTGAVTTYVSNLPSVQGLPLLAVAERDGWPTKLIIAARDLSGSKLHKYDMMSGALDPVCWDPGSCHISLSNIVLDIAVTADGANLVIASGAQYHTLMSVFGLSVVRTYPTGAYPTAVGVGENGQLALGSESPNAYENDVYGYDVTGSQPNWTYDFGIRATAYNDLAPRGLAWAPGNAFLYAVITDNDGSAPVLHTLVPTV